MKKTILTLLAALLVFSSFSIVASNAAEKKTKTSQNAKQKAKVEKVDPKKEAKYQEKALKRAAKDQANLKKKNAKIDKQIAKSQRGDKIKDVEYKKLKTEFFDADGWGHTYNCRVERQKFCKVKDLDTGMYVLCDRNVSRTQWESAKIFYKYGRCTKMN